MRSETSLTATTVLRFLRPPTSKRLVRCSMSSAMTGAGAADVSCSSCGSGIGWLVIGGVIVIAMAPCSCGRDCQGQGPRGFARERRLSRCLLLAGHQKSRGPDLASGFRFSGRSAYLDQTGTDLPRSETPKGASDRSAEAAAVRRLMFNIRRSAPVKAGSGASAIAENRRAARTLSNECRKRSPEIGKRPRERHRAAAGLRGFHILVTYSASTQPTLPLASLPSNHLRPWPSYALSV